MLEDREKYLLLELEEQVRLGYETLLRTEVPNTCRCSAGEVTKVFRCPEAFYISCVLDKLEEMRRK